MPKSPLLLRWYLTVSVKETGKRIPHVIATNHDGESEARKAYGDILAGLKSNEKITYANLTPPGDAPMIRLDREKS